MSLSKDIGKCRKCDLLMHQCKCHFNTIAEPMDEEEPQKCPKCNGWCEDIMWYHSGSIDYKCKECGHEFNVYILEHLDEEDEDE